MYRIATRPFLLHISFNTSNYFWILLLGVSLSLSCAMAECRSNWVMMVFVKSVIRDAALLPVYQSFIIPFTNKSVSYS